MASDSRLAMASLSPEASASTSVDATVAVTETVASLTSAAGLAACAGGPMREDDLRAVLAELGGRSFAPELDAWVHGTDELPLAELLGAHGVRMQAEAPQIAQRLGLRINENHSVQIKTVLRHGAAERAGMAAGDEWLGVEVAGQGWRLARLDELPLLAGAARELTALVARDGRLLRLPLVLPEPGGAGAPAETFRLSVADGAALGRWLDAPPL